MASAAAISPFAKPAFQASLASIVEQNAHRPLSELAGDEDFWFYVKQAYTVSPNLLNLNNGGVSPQPRTVQEAVEHYNRLSNEAPSYYMWRVLDSYKEPVRTKLADIAGCSPDEIAIHRNTTEALANVIFGLQLKPGDEVVLTKQDYPNMINAWKQREKRDGIVLKWLNLELPVEDNELIVREFEKMFTPRTKIVHITHMINWNGQLLPAKQIAQAAHRRGIEVLVDAAHTFAHIDFKIPDLECDYLGTSLHKWLCAPFGSGLLYIKKEKIKNIYPLMASDEKEADNIRKFEHLGTRSMAIEEAISHAVDFHQMIGMERKAERLYFLKKYWVDKVNGLPGVSIPSPTSPGFSGAIALLSIEGKTAVELSEQLYRDYKIHTTAINWENISGVRVTPNVYTSLNDLDRFVAAVKEIAQA
jgi:selenocysteine lyase/cysteine desulfurase